MHVDRHPVDAITGAGVSEELPAMRTTEAIDEYDLVALWRGVARTCTYGARNCLCRYPLFWVMSRWEPSTPGGRANTTSAEAKDNSGAESEIILPVVEPVRNLC